jgi:hypothetical protein
VHLATREWIRKAESLEEYTYDVLNHLEHAFWLPESRGRVFWRSHLPHAQYAQNHRPGSLPNAVEARLMIRIGECLTHDGRYAEAEKVLTKATNALDKRVKRYTEEGNLEAFNLEAYAIYSMDGMR